MVIVGVFYLLRDGHLNYLVIQLGEGLARIEPMRSKHCAAKELVLPSTEHRVTLDPLG